MTDECLVNVDVREREEIQVDPQLTVEDRDMLEEFIKPKEINITSEEDGDRRTKIQRVPHIMLQPGNFEEYYKPRAIPIGPIHQKISKIQLKRKHKVKLATEFIESSGEKKESLLLEVKKSIPELKKRFDEEVIHRYDDEELARMLFLDACSVLQFIYSYVRDELKQFEINNGQAALVQQDLFLLNNQIPFRVLKLLMDMSKKKGELRRCIISFIHRNIIAPLDFYPLPFLYKLLQPQAEEPVHLLDLLRSAILLGGDGQSCQQSDSQYNSYTGYFRNVQELKAAGIKLKPSNSCRLTAISFSTRCFLSGQLKLPPLIVDESTRRKLYNLVAYEMCPDNCKTNFAVTGYVSFLDSLIDNEQDVRYLRLARILRNHLSSDAEVADLFNKIACNLGSRDAYVSVKKKIQRYYERKCPTWIAQVSHDHFRNPFTILALAIAAVALILTVMQTWYAGHQKS
ncbi:hypothetical protein TIFTF001_030022 [Ficus carica]|uniref:Uncharacterized protein n=1 Tax=Ficus carica TaxID=3494 RepID=A0AA88IYZ9_FICCA|nr:hypothetical protein TIFTF001_030022 [Ficus carica]